MKAKEKALAAFLVSVGIYSAAQAVQYVATLTAKEKKSLFFSTQHSDDQVQLFAGTVFTSEGGNKPG